MPNHTTLLSLALASLLVAGCKKDDPEPVDLGYDYFPRTVGSWIDYQVDSIYRDDAFSIHDTTSYVLREKIVEAYTDPAGRAAWRIHRFVKTPAGDWRIRDVWTSTKDAFYAEVSEENMRRLKLSFPIRTSRAWDMNIYNNDDELSVAPVEVDVPWSAGALSFEQTVMVKNTVPANFVDRNEQHERYARNIGLVYKFREIANVQTTGYTGWKLKATAVDYGQD
ncbi:MAG: hypothetical protein IPL52_01980 [Flavobacteriales bacterium]|nr:hypothetical protein [Flavobacteriales bacterium]